MAIISTSNYRVGKSYKFILKDKEIFEATVKEKGYKKLLLVVSGLDGKVVEHWYDNSQLSPAKPHSGSKKVTNVTETSEQLPKTAKVEATKPMNITMGKDADIEAKKIVAKFKKSEADSIVLNLRPSEERDNRFWECQMGLFLSQLKKRLIAKGYGLEVKNYNSTELSDLIIKNIRTPKK